MTRVASFDVALLSEIGCHRLDSFQGADAIADHYSTGSERVEIRLAAAAAEREDLCQKVKLRSGLTIEITHTGWIADRLSRTDAHWPAPPIAGGCRSAS